MGYFCGSVRYLQAVPQEELATGHVRGDEREISRSAARGAGEGGVLLAEEELWSEREEELVCQARFHEGPVQAGASLYEEPFDAVPRSQSLQEVV